MWYWQFFGLYSGSAGGRLPGQGAGGNGASYHDTPHAKTGDIGSKLLQAWSTAVPTTWKAGSVVEVAWALAANHGGGYRYGVSYPSCRFAPSS